jgi:ribosomal protein S18 acetylase RimI-like enzyme
MAFEIRPLSPEYRDWATQLIKEQWGSERIVTRGIVHRTEYLPGYVAVQEGKPVGLVTFAIHPDETTHRDEIEIVTLNSLVECMGVGSALIGAVVMSGACANCKRVWLITTNDNLNAWCFYQKRGFHLVAVYPNALEQSRKLKPEIPLIGMEGIPLRDEIEFELQIRNPKST